MSEITTSWIGTFMNVTLAGSEGRRYFDLWNAIMEFRQYFISRGAVPWQISVAANGPIADLLSGINLPLWEGWNYKGIRHQMAFWVHTDYNIRKIKIISALGNGHIQIENYDYGSLEEWRRLRVDEHLRSPYVANFVPYFQVEKERFDSQEGF